MIIAPGKTARAACAVKGANQSPVSIEALVDMVYDGRRLSRRIQILGHTFFGVASGS